MIRARPAPAPAPAGYLDVILSGPPAELNDTLDGLEFVDSYIGSTRRLVTGGGDVAVKVRFRDDGTMPLLQLPAVGGWLPAVRDNAPVEPVHDQPPLRAQAVVERPAPGTVADRSANVPWWEDRQRVALAGLAAVASLAVVGLVLWAVVSAVAAGVQAVAQHADAIIGFLALAIVGFLAGRALLRRTVGGCSGLHCTGCKYH